MYVIRMSYVIWMMILYDTYGTPKNYSFLSYSSTIVIEGVGRGHCKTGSFNARVCSSTQSLK